MVLHWSVHGFWWVGKIALSRVSLISLSLRKSRLLLRGCNLGASVLISSNSMILMLKKKCLLCSSSSPTLVTVDPPHCWLVCWCKGWAQMKLWCEGRGWLSTQRCFSSLICSKAEDEEGIRRGGVDCSEVQIVGWAMMTTTRSNRMAPHYQV